MAEDQPEDRKLRLSLHGMTPEEAIKKMFAVPDSGDYRRGRTTNEVLFEAGELDAFDMAGRARDAGRMIASLMRAGVPQEEAEQITDTVLANPENYGF
jgi:hypothetical protein